jgi:hypothetical protein
LKKPIEAEAEGPQHGQQKREAQESRADMSTQDGNNSGGLHLRPEATEQQDEDDAGNSDSKVLHAIQIPEQTRI